MQNRSRASMLHPLHPKLSWKLASRNEMIRKEKKWSGRKDLNLRPPGPEPGALARLRYAPNDTLRPALSKRELQLNTSDCGWGTATRVRTACRKREPLGSESSPAAVRWRSGIVERLRTRSAIRIPLRVVWWKVWCSP